MDTGRPWHSNPGRPAQRCRTVANLEAIDTDGLAGSPPRPANQAPWWRAFAHYRSPSLKHFAAAWACLQQRNHAIHGRFIRLKYANPRHISWKVRRYFGFLPASSGLLVQHNAREQGSSASAFSPSFLVACQPVESALVIALFYPNLLRDTTDDQWHHTFVVVYCAHRSCHQIITERPSMRRVDQQ